MTVWNQMDPYWVCNSDFTSGPFVHSLEVALILILRYKLRVPEIEMPLWGCVDYYACQTVSPWHEKVWEPRTALKGEVTLKQQAGGQRWPNGERSCLDTGRSPARIPDQLPTGTLKLSSALEQGFEPQPWNFLLNMQGLAVNKYLCLVHSPWVNK